MMFYEEDAIGELQQEELVWKAEHLTMMQEQYCLDDSGNNIPPEDPPQEIVVMENPSDNDKKPMAKANFGKGMVLFSVLNWSLIFFFITLKYYIFVFSNIQLIQ
jgi:hypothetical protein